MSLRPFYYLRHGQTDWNLAERMQGGASDIPLNAEGERQAHAAAEVLATHPFDLIISSDLSRAHKTAQAVATRKQLPLLTDPNLREVDFGSYEGRTKLEIRQELNLAPLEKISHNLPGDAEPWATVKARVLAAITYHLTTHPAQKILFVAHGALFRALNEALGHPEPFEAANATPYRYDPATRIWQQLA